MLVSKSGRFIRKILSPIINLYGCIWSREDGYKEYYLKLDGYYYDEKLNLYKAIIRIRNKRISEEIPIKDIVNDKEYLKELHPVDTFAIGLLANIERNGIISDENIGWHKMSRAKNYECNIKSEPILQIAKKYININGTELVTLRSNILDKEIIIPTHELYKNQALLYSIGNYQAIEVGYDVSEIYLRKNPNVI